MNVIKIEDWMVIHLPADPHLVDEGQTQHLKGKILNHPNCHIGGTATTSPVTGRYGNFIVTKSRRVYELGRALPEYEARFPDAANQLLQTLPEIKGIMP